MPDVLQEEETQQDEGQSELSETVKSSLKDMMKKASEREMFARIWEIRDSWMQRMFERGNQHLYWDGNNNTFQVSGSTGGSQTADESNASNQPTYNDNFNIYLGYEKSFCAVFCQNQASNRAEPENPKEAMDIAAAREAQKMKRVVEDKFDHKEMQRKIARYLFTDRRVVAWTRFVPKKDEEGNEQGKKVTDIFGTLESKVPISSQDISKWPYCQIAFEVDITLAKYENRDIKKSITGGAGGASADLVARNARISCSQGTFLQSQAGESTGNLCTETHNFFRPSWYEVLEDTARDEMLAEYPDGVYAKFIDDVLSIVEPKELEDEISIMHALPGDGQSRVSIGSVMVPIQENFNDLMNQAIEIYDYCIPQKWVDEKIIDIDAIQEQQTQPGTYQPCERENQLPLSENFWEETAITMPADMAAFMEKLATELPQFLTAQQPALMGAEMGEAGKTAKGYQMAAGQALGIMGYIWKPYTTFYATITQQSVDCTAKARAEEGSMTALVPKVRKSSGREEVSIDLQDLNNGHYRFKAEGDAQFPESWTQKRAVYMTLMQGAESNPEVAKELNQPDNKALGRDLLGLEDFTVVDADSRDKQLQEIDEMIKGPGPMPDEQKIQQDVQGVQNMEATGQQVPEVKPEDVMKSSIPIDPEYDNHQVEYEEVQRYVNSPEGLKLKTQNPPAFQDIRLHGLEHKQILMQQQAAMQAAAAMQKPAAPQGAPANA